MTKAHITARIKLFESVVNTHSTKIHGYANASWVPIKETSETKTVRQFLVKRNAGIDYLNRNVAPLVSKDGRVVKFAGLFLHGTPMVKGWTKNAGTGEKIEAGTCELADLMSVFLYLDSGNDEVKQFAEPQQTRFDWSTALRNALLVGQSQADL